MTEQTLRSTLPAGSRVARHPEGDGWIVAHPDYTPAWHRLSGEVVPLGEFGQIPPYRCEQPSAHHVAK